jgi:DNA-binding NtrC family response regulator
MPKASRSPQPNQPHRRILIIEKEPSIRNAIYVLCANLGYDGEVADCGRQALAMMSRRRFDAVLLDLGCTDVSGEQVVDQTRKMRPAMMGRLLLITGKVVRKRTLRFVERFHLRHIPRHRIMQEMWANLMPMLRVSHP